jgi:hypothetical protein
METIKARKKCKEKDELSREERGILKFSPFFCVQAISRSEQFWGKTKKKVSFFLSAREQISAKSLYFGPMLGNNNSSNAFNYIL